MAYGAQIDALIMQCVRQITSNKEKDVVSKTYSTEISISTRVNLADNCGEIWDFSKRIINVNFNNKGEGGKNAYHGIEIAIESGKGRSP